MPLREARDAAIRAAQDFGAQITLHHTDDEDRPTFFHFHAELSGDIYSSEEIERKKRLEAAIRNALKPHEGKGITWKTFFFHSTDETGHGVSVYINQAQ